MRFLSTLLIILLMSCTAAADETPSLSFLRGRHEEIRSAIAAHDTGRLIPLLDETLDYDRLTKDSFGSHWGPMTPAQQSEASSLMKVLLRRSYESNVKAVSGTIITWGASDDTTVRSTVTSHIQRTTTDVDYKVDRRGSTFVVVDVIVEGSSLVLNYKRQFDKIIKRDGVEAVLKKLRDKSKT